MHKVCKESEIKDESINRFRVDSKDIIIGKHDGKLFACSNICPHKHASMHKGWFNGNNIVCYMHYYEYNIQNGNLEKIHEMWDKQSPRWRESGNLPIYNVIIKDDEIFVEAK